MGGKKISLRYMYVCKYRRMKLSFLEVLRIKKNENKEFLETIFGCFSNNKYQIFLKNNNYRIFLF